MASGSPETMTELIDGIEPVESKSLFPKFFHDALQERMGQVGSGDDEEIELSEGRGTIIHERFLVFRNAGTRRQEDLSPHAGIRSKNKGRRTPQNHGMLRRNRKTPREKEGDFGSMVRPWRKEPTFGLVSGRYPIDGAVFLG